MRPMARTNDPLDSGVHRLPCQLDCMVDVGISDDLIRRLRNAFEGEQLELLFTNLSAAEGDRLREVFSE